MMIATAVVMATLAAGSGFVDVEYRVERSDSKALLLSGKMPLELNRPGEVIRQNGADKIEFEFTPRASDAGMLVFEVRLAEHDAAGQFLSQKFSLRVKRGDEAVVGLEWEKGGRSIVFKVK